MSEKQSGDIILAVIGAPHGVKGELRVKSFTEDPEGFGDYGPLHDAAGNLFTVDETRISKSVVVTRFREVTTREAAEALTGTELYVKRALLPETDDPDEFYLEDLIGLSGVSPDGQVLGTVKAVHDFGAGDILEIQFRDGSTDLLPFTREIVPEIDLAEGKLVLVTPEKGDEQSAAAKPGAKAMK